MAQTGYTPLLVYGSTTPGNTPSAANLTTSASGVELAINAFDGKLFYKDASGNVQVLAGKGGTGVVAGSNTQVQFNNNGVFGASSGLTWDGTNLTASQLRSSGLTSGRVTYASTSGLLVDSANMTFNGTRLTVADLADSGLTSGRVVYASTGGSLVDSANLTFDGTTLTANALTTTSTVTINGGTANGVAYLNGSKVLTTGSALTFDGTSLGVGTASPAEKVAVSQGNFYALRTGGAKLRLADQNNECSVESLPVSGDSVLVFKTNATEQMRLTSTGLGIGTSSPAVRLQVSSGEARARLTATNASGGSWELVSGGGGVAGAGFFSLYDVGNNAQKIVVAPSAGEAMRIDSSNNVGIGTSSPGYKLDVVGFGRFSSGVLGSGGLTMYGDASSASGLLLSTSGNLGLGVTPSAWSGLKAFEIAGVGSSIASASNNNLFISANAWYNGTNWRYGISSEATQYQSFAGAHRWYTAPAGVAGNAISFTQAMTLTTGGNLLVGTTTDGGQRARIARNGAGVILNLGDNTAQNFDISSNAASGSSGVITLDTSNGAAQAFSIGGTERARIDSSGNLLVGTTTASGRVTINSGSFGAQILNMGDGALDGTNYGMVQVTRPATNDTKFAYCFIRNGNAIGGIGFAQSSNTAVFVNGGNNANNGMTLAPGGTSWGTQSDIRKKNILGNIEDALDKVSTLRTVFFEYKNDEDKKRRVGFIAQDVQAVLPEAVHVDDDADNTLNLQYSDVIPLLTAAIQELKAEFDAYKATHP